MKFKCIQADLAKTLNIVTRALSARTTIPVLKDIRIDTLGKDKIKISATNLDLSIEKEMAANVIEEGSVLVEGKLFSDIVRKFSPGEVSFTVENEGKTASLACMNSSFNIMCGGTEEFPNLGEASITAEDLILNKEMFKEMIRKTAFSAGIDESKGVIVGILIELEKESTNFVALDGFRMAVARAASTNNEETRRFIISAKIMNEIAKLLSDVEDDSEDVKMKLDEKKAFIFFKDTKVSMRLLEGEFIKYKDILPKEAKCSLKIDKDDLLNSIDRASLLAKEGRNNLVKLTIKDKKMVVTSRSEEGDVREEIEIDKMGDDLEIGFNAKFINDALKCIDDEEVVMEMNTSVSPCIIKPIEGDSYTYLILPVRLQA